MSKTFLPSVFVQLVEAFQDKNYVRSRIKYTENISISLTFVQLRKIFRKIS